MYPALTTVSTSAWSFGHVGADLLLDEITGHVREPVQRTVQWRLEVRQSTVWEPAVERRGVLTEIT
jgi:DNA-binding LacI/PurR family transcriptional regulator